MTQWRINLDVRQSHQAIIDTDWIDELDDDSTEDEVAAYFDELEGWRLAEYVQGDLTWVDDVDVEFEDIYPIGD